jgi:WD40 repeat protein
MIAARKVKSFCMDPDERRLYAGTLSGQIWSVDIDAFRIEREVQAHPGGIIAMASHPTLPYVASMGMDRSVVVWRRSGGGALDRLFDIRIRDVRCDNDTVHYAPIMSVAQALAFHDTERRLVTRSGNAGVLELRFDDERYEIVRCLRQHGTDDVVTVRYLKDSGLVFSGSNAGRVAITDEGNVVNAWRFGHETIHWAEHIAGSEYLLASDTRCVIRLDVTGARAPVVGPKFTRDDLEHVTYNRASGRAFASSFDRNIYEVDVETCEPKGIAYRTPFKCRWIKTLERDSNVLLVQCRNGSLYKADLRDGSTVAAIRETPPALWTAAKAPGRRIFFAGEGDQLLTLQADGADRASRLPRFEAVRRTLPVDPFAYTKRMVVQKSTGLLILGRTDGDIVTGDGNEFRKLLRLPTPIRDVAVHDSEPLIYVAGENGHVYKIDLAEKRILLEYESTQGEPVWSLAYNADRDLLALGEREGRMVLLRGGDFSEVRDSITNRRPKRMKWLDADRLILGHSARLFLLDGTDDWLQRSFVDHQGNTIEDFIWDPQHRYLVLLNYQRNAILCDLATGTSLHECSDQMDYTKGALWLDEDLDSSGYGYYFLTFGRSGAVHLFAIHDEKILSIGPVASLHSAAEAAP